MKRDQWDDFWPDQAEQRAHDRAVAATYPAAAGEPFRADQQDSADRARAARRATT